MSRTYLFFRPTRLPLRADELDAHAVRPLNELALQRMSLARVLPEIEWQDEVHGRADVDGEWVELSLGSAERTLALRCSLRADLRPLVQRLCDELRWVAFDERPMCYQPGEPPMPT